MSKMAATSAGTQEDFPTELQDKLSNFDESLSRVEAIMQPLLSQPRSEIHEKLTPLENARLDLIEAYALNSLFWMYLNVLGQNPKEHPVKQELERIRSYMDRLKGIQEKEKAPKLDVKASKKFVRSALWQAAHKKAESSQDSSVDSGQDTPKQPPTKRPRTDSPQKQQTDESVTKKKKKKNKK